MLAGTMIAMSDGSAKPVETVTWGDMVLAYDSLSGRIVASEVLKVHTPYVVKTFLVINGRTRVTENHPFLRDGAWIAAGKLKIGDRLVGSQGQSVPVVSVETVVEDELVYNFQVAQRSYIADGLVVHNKEDCEEFTMYCPACE